MLWKILTVLADGAALGLIYRWMKKSDNVMNMNRNSGSVAVLYDCVGKTKGGCFLFVDNGAMSNQGFYEVAKKIENQSVLVLDCIASGEDLFLAYREGREKTAKELADAFECPVRLLSLSEEQYRNTPLESFQEGYMLTSGSMKKGTVHVKHARRRSDYDMDLDRMQQIENGILHMCAK